MKSIYLPFSGDNKLRFGGSSLISHKITSFLTSCSVVRRQIFVKRFKRPKNRFYEEKKNEINIFTIFRRQKLKILGIFFNFYIKWRHFLRRAPSYDIKYLSNVLKDLANGFYEEKNPKIHIFTIFRRQKHKILWIFFNFDIKLRNFLRCAGSYDFKYLSNYLNDLKYVFHEERSTEIQIFTIFRRQKLRFGGFSSISS